MANGHKAETWSIESPPPSFFRIHGASKSDFENALGNTVTAEASQAKDNFHSGLLRTIKLPNAKIVSACPRDC